MFETIIVLVYIALLIILLIVNLAKKTINNDFKLYIMTHVIMLIYLIVRAIHLIQNESIILRFDSIENQNKYWRLITNGLVLENKYIFYPLLLINWLGLYIIEKYTSSLHVFTMWFSVLFINQFISWIHYYNLKKTYDVYLVPYQYGFVALFSSLLMYFIVSTKIQTPKNNKPTNTLMIFIIFLIFLLNVINSNLYDQTYNVINTNIGYFIGSIFALGTIS